MAEEAITFKSITDRIVKESGNVDIASLPFGEQVMWFGLEDESVQGAGNSVLTRRGTTVFRIGQPMPNVPTLTVFQIFADEDEIRLYVAPNQEAAKLGKPEAMRCFHLSKKAPVYFVESMPLGAFITAVASEWSVLAYDMTPVDREREVIAEFIRDGAKSGLAPSPYELANAIESGEYAEEDEDDSPESPDPPQNAPGPTSPEPQ